MLRNLSAKGGLWDLSVHKKLKYDVIYYSSHIRITIGQCAIQNYSNSTNEWLRFGNSHDVISVLSGKLCTGVVLSGRRLTAEQDTNRRNNSIRYRIKIGSEKRHQQNHHLLLIIILGMTFYKTTGYTCLFNNYREHLFLSVYAS